jgi:hypothetical protein
MTISPPAAKTASSGSEAVVGGKPWRGHSRRSTGGCWPMSGGWQVARDLLARHLRCFCAGTPPAGSIISASNMADAVV